ncbi:MAG: NADH:ubiquinone reductase (Na(+)-transporting) subunit A, partial [Zoogloeaceae bacterium]|nr:NADH:ubiquinone reductase (Na(+)-transporting) subunit A [Zoogloeaceae bacterium]
MIRIKRGLDLPITGAPQQTLSAARAVHSVALLGPDYHGLKPSLAVQVGDRVKIGQTLFLDKTTPGVHFTAPAAGVVTAIHRGARRVLQAVVIAPESATGEAEEAIEFARHDDATLAGLPAEAVVENLAASGLWTALRTRPFSRTPTLESRPASLFVTAIDTHPLAANPGIVIAMHREDFRRGLVALARLAPRVFVCTDASTDLPCENLANVTLARFSGPHPAGLPGTHIHFL